ncbi:membrane protein insertion efficiency factor YidD [Fibrisoma limi]|uniref:membrane protein insertion efficiency factor YidD n=1 Tax=Fibrisoma limi TaxID=663275 RepID=UPI00031A6A60|nr:membrane protein insertion efficiency factor YidD [Fibrisoma limi]
MKFLLPFLFSLLVSPIARSQSTSADWQLVSERNFQTDNEFAQYRRPGNDVQAVVYKQRSWLAMYNPLSLALKGAMLGYQRLMSQQLARSCPYQTTCSNFSKQAIQQFGTLKGVFLSADRIMRCNRLGLLDVHTLSRDPVDGSIVDTPDLYRLR